MKFAEILKLSLNGLTHRGLRSWLTILGIIVGEVHNKHQRLIPQH